ncbi:MAG: site-specific integrase, partial [Pseudomonadota bacterium]
MHDLIHQFLDYLAVQRRYGSHTIAAYQRDLDEFAQFQQNLTGGPLSKADLATLSTSDLRAWLAERRSRNLASTSLARGLSALRSFFAWGERHGGFTNQAIKLIRSPKLPKPLPRAITIHDALALIDHQPADRRPAWIKARDCA